MLPGVTYSKHALGLAGQARPGVGWLAGSSYTSLCLVAAFFLWVFKHICVVWSQLDLICSPCVLYTLNILTQYPPAGSLNTSSCLVPSLPSCYAVEALPEFLFVECKCWEGGGGGHRTNSSLSVALPRIMLGACAAGQSQRRGARGQRGRPCDGQPPFLLLRGCPCDGTKPFKPTGRPLSAMCSISMGGFGSQVRSSIQIPSNIGNVVQTGEVVRNGNNNTNNIYFYGKQARSVFNHDVDPDTELAPWFVSGQPRNEVRHPGYTILILLE